MKDIPYDSALVCYVHNTNKSDYTSQIFTIEQIHCFFGEEKRKTSISEYATNIFIEFVYYNSHNTEFFDDDNICTSIVNNDTLMIRSWMSVYNNNKTIHSPYIRDKIQDKYIQVAHSVIATIDGIAYLNNDIEMLYNNSTTSYDDSINNTPLKDIIAFIQRDKDYSFKKNTYNILHSVTIK